MQPTGLMRGSRERLDAADSGHPPYTLRYRTDWADRFAFANELMGTGGRDGAAGDTTLPAQHPARPGFYASSCSIYGVGPVRWRDGEPKQDAAVLFVDFAEPDWDRLMASLGFH